VFETVDRDTVFYSSGSATRAYKKDPGIGKPIRCLEFIDCGSFIGKFPSRAHRLEATFWYVLSILHPAIQVYAKVLLH